MQWLIVGISASIAIGFVAVFLLAPGSGPALFAAAAAIEPTEHKRTIEALRPPKRARPVIAVVGSNATTEVTDFLSTYGVLARAGVADVIVVAERSAQLRLDPLSLAPVRLYSATLWVEPQSTMQAFDARYPHGADYVVVPAIEPRGDNAVTDWIVVQRNKGAKIISVCNGSLTLAAAGLLDGRRATAHWSGIPQLLKAHPTMQWVQNRRYVVDDGIMTSTGIAASLPAMVALVEAIAGRDKAEPLAAQLGLPHWDERHDTSAFELTGEHKKTFVRNLLSFWRHETVGIPVHEGLDEIALGLTVDTYVRTGLAKVVTLGPSGKLVRSRHGLNIRPEMSLDAAKVDCMLPSPPLDAPALAMERELANIAARYDHRTAELTALVLEYPWSATITSTGR